MPFHQIEQEAGGFAGHRHQPCADVSTEMRLNLVWLVLEAGIHLPAIATRGTKTRLHRFQHDHLQSSLSGMQCG